MWEQTETISTADGRDSEEQTKRIRRLLFGLAALVLFSIVYSGLLALRADFRPLMVVPLAAAALLAVLLLLTWRALARISSQLARSSGALADLNAALSQRVEERTRDLILAAEVATSLGQIRELNPLLTRAVEIIRSRFDLYHVQIYLTDSSMRSLHLQAGTGEAGRLLLEENHSLPLGVGSINGAAAADKQTIVVPDTAASPLFRPNPLLPDTRSELAVPIISADRVVGVLNVQSSQVGLIQEDWMPTFEALAGQLAIAIENARLFDQLERSQEEILLQAQRLNQRDWETFFDQNDSDEALTFQLAAPKTAAAEARESYQLPIELGGLPIGRLSLDLPAGRLTDEDQAFVTAVAHQLATRVDNLRLLSQAEHYRLEGENTLKRMTREGWVELFNLRKNTGPQVMGFRLEAGELHAEPLTPDAAVDGLRQETLQVRGEPIGELLFPAEAGSGEREIAAAVAASLSDHLENLRLAAATERRAAELAIINRVNETIRGQQDPALIFDAVGEELRHAFAASTTYIATFDEEQQEYSFPYYVTDDEDGVLRRKIDPQPLGTGLTSQIITTRRPLLINADSQDDILAAGAVQLDEQTEHTHYAYLGVPILLGDGVLGVISVQDGSGQRQFAPADEALLSTIASGLAIAIENGRLFRQTQKALEASLQQSEELEAINRVVVTASATQDLETSIQRVANELLNVTDADQVGVALLNPDGQSLRVVAAAGGGATAKEVIGQQIPVEGNPATQAVLRTRRTQIFEDAQHHPMLAPVHSIMRARQVHTLAILPLTTFAGVIGTVGLDVTQPGKSLTPYQIQLAETILLQASAIIESNRLFTAVQKRAQQEQRVREITDRIRRGMDRESILKIAREEIGRYIGATDSVAWLGTRELLAAQIETGRKATAPNGRLSESEQIEEGETHAL